MIIIGFIFVFFIGVVCGVALEVYSKGFRKKVERQKPHLPKVVPPPPPGRRR